MSLGLRVRGFTRVALEDALWKKRSLVKTYALRGTVHIVPAKEFGFWLAALREAGRPEDDPARLAYLGMSARDLAATIDAIGETVGREPITREELGAAVAKRVGRWAVDRTVGAFGGRWPVWQAGIGGAARRGLLCFGPTDGVRVTFVNPESWLGPFVVPDARSAERELFLRYLRAYGPAGHADFAQWSTLAPSRAKAIVAELDDAVERVEVDGTPALQIAGDRPSTRAARSTLLLPRFDSYVVGSHPRDVLIPPPVVASATKTGLLKRGNTTGRAFLAGPMPVLLVDGVVGGIWESTRTSRELRVTVQPFVPLDKDRRAAIQRTAARLGAVLGLDASVRVGSVKTRPHL